MSEPEKSDTDDTGEISVFGHNVLTDPTAAKRLIAWAPDEPMLYDRLTPMEYLEFVAGLWGVEASVALPRAADRASMVAASTPRSPRSRTTSFHRTSSRDAADYGTLAADNGARGFVPKSELSGAAMEALL